MKFVSITLVVVLVAVMCYISATTASPLEDWAKHARLEKVTVRPGQTVISLIRKRVPEGIRARGDMTNAVTIIGDRQGKQLGKVDTWEEILLPVAYTDWRPY